VLHSHVEYVSYHSYFRYKRWARVLSVTHTESGLPISRTRLDPILGSTLPQLNEFCLPDIPTAQELNIQCQTNLNEISRLRALSRKVNYTSFCGPPWFIQDTLQLCAIRLNTVFAWLTCSKPEPGGLMS